MQVNSSLKLVAQVDRLGKKDFVTLAFTNQEFVGRSLDVTTVQGTSEATVVVL